MKTLRLRRACRYRYKWFCPGNTRIGEERVLLYDAWLVPGSTQSPSRGLFPVRGALDESACQTADVVLALIHLEDWCIHRNCPNMPPGSSWFSRVLHSRWTFVTSWTQISCWSTDWRVMKHEQKSSFAPQFGHQQQGCINGGDTWRVSEENKTTKGGK